jgi:hypothetical protein
VVCDGGNGKSTTTFETGVTVSVGASMNGDFERRACRATLSWDKQSLNVVAEAARVDIDALGVDLGFGAPVVAFQIAKSDSPSQMTYEIYSLAKPPRLLRTIAGGDFFRATDTDMDGRIEIWTGDASAADGFDGLKLDEFDFAPPTVFQFDHRRLIDVSAEFAPRFDEKIATLRGQLTPQALADFKNSDGRVLAAAWLPMVRRDQLRNTKTKVLEIVWCYLYSGREQEAWNALNEMWPAGDFDRVRAILDGRAHGIRAQADGAMAETVHTDLKKHVFVYDAPSAVQKSVNDGLGNSRRGNYAGMHEQPEGAAVTDTAPQAIMLRLVAAESVQQSFPKSGEVVELVINVAGKVQSAKPVGDVDVEVLSTAPEWKFIPAFKGGHAVACRFRMAVTLGQ